MATTVGDGGGSSYRPTSGPAAGPSAQPAGKKAVDPKVAAAAARRRKKLAEQAAAVAAAKAAAEKKRLRHQAYLDLQARANNLRANMRGPATGKPSSKPAVSGARPGSMSSLEMKARQQAAVTVENERRAKQARTMNPAEEQRLEKLYTRNKAKFQQEMGDRKDRTTVADARLKKGTDLGTVKELEKILDARTKRAVSSGGKDIDVKFVTEVRDALAGHALKVRDELIAASNKLNNGFVFDKKGNPIRWKGTKESYNKLLKSFNDLRAEHNRLFIDVQKDPKHTQGALYVAMTQADQIALSQRKYIRDAAKSVFIGSDPHNIASRTAAWEREKWSYVVELSAADIDPTQTSFIYETDKKTGRITGRRRTPEEEYKYRQGLYKAEMERRMKEFEARQALLRPKVTDMVEGRTEFVQARDMRIRQALVDAQNRLGTPAGRSVFVRGKGWTTEAGVAPGSDPKFLDKRENVERVVDEAMRKWDEDNKRLYLTSKPGTGSYASDGMTPADRVKFQKARREAEENFYAALGSVGNSAIDKLANSPISVLTTPLLATLSGSAGLITGTARLGLQYLTGDSKYYTPIGHGDMPKTVVADINKRAMAQAKADMAAKRPGDAFITENGQYIKYQREYTKQWLDGAGKQWRDTFEKDRHEVADKETESFIHKFYGGTPFLPDEKGGDLWEKMNALGEYGATPTSNAALNLALGIALDPTIAMPMKFTTWAARWAHASQATKGMNLAQRVTKGLVEFQKVDEPTLRWQKFVRPYMEDIAKGADPRILEEGVLQRLAGIKDVGTRNKATDEFLRSIGVDTRSTSGKLMLNSTQEAIVAKMKAMGVNYEDVAAKAKKFELDRRETAKLLKDEETRAAALVDAREQALVAQKLAEGVEHRRMLAEERTAAIEAEKVAIRKQKELEALERQAAPPLETQAAPTMQGSVHEPPGEHFDPLAQEAPSPLRRRDDTRIGQALREEQEPLVKVRSGQYAAGEVLVSDAAGTAATISHIIHGGGADNVQKGGVRFARGPYLDTFMASKERAEISRILNAPLKTKDPKSGRIVGPEGSVTLAEQRQARADLREAGEQSIAARQRHLEGLHVREGTVFDEFGNLVPGESRYAIRGAETSSKQYIPSSADMAARAGMRTPIEEIRWAEFQNAFEKVKKRVLAAGAGKRKWQKTRHELAEAQQRVKLAREWENVKTKGGAIELADALRQEALAKIAYKKADKARNRLRQSQLDRMSWDDAEAAGKAYDPYDRELESIRLIGVFRNSSDLTIDIAAGDARLMVVSSGELDHIMGAGLRNFVPVGNALVNDFLGSIVTHEGVTSAGHLNHYYETLSLLKELSTGPGYETDLMRLITTRGFREQLDAEGFAALIRERLFDSDRAAPPSPQQFRQASQHLFALFHLSKIDAEDALKEIGGLKKMLQEGAITKQDFDTKVAYITARSNGSVERLREYSLVMKVLAKTDPDNIYARMWAVMEARGGGEGMWWAGKIGETEVDFAQCVLIQGHILHPNLALQMIPYGPAARNVPTNHGYTFHMRNFASTPNPLFPGSPPFWTDNVIIDIMGKIANPNTGPEGGIKTASMIAHYLATRYGSSLRRMPFRSALNDFSIDELYRYAQDAGNVGDYQYQNLRSHYIKYRMSVDVEAIDPERIGNDFDRLFTVPVVGEPGAGNTKRVRRQYDDVHKVWEDLYWKNEVGHHNAGLHTMKFFERMSEPNMQRGDTWLKYANSYYLHMVASGEEDYAREVLGVMFEQRIYTEARNALETLKEVPESATLSHNVWRGGVREFFVKANLLGDMERILAEGEKRVQYEKQFAQLESEAAAMRDELLIEDDALREQRRAAQSVSDSSAMYDMATVEHITDASVRASDEAFAAARDRKMLTDGLTQMQKAVRDAVRLEEEAVAAVKLGKKSGDLRAAKKAVAASEKAHKKARALVRRQNLEVKAQNALAFVQDQLAKLPADASEEARTLALRKVEVAQQKVDELGIGTHELSPTRKVTTGIRRPGKARMKAYHAKYYDIVKMASRPHLAAHAEFAAKLPPDVRKLFLAGKGRQAANKYLETIPPDAMAYMRAEVRQRDAEREMTKLLNIVIHRTKDNGAIPVHVGDQMEVLVKTIKDMPNGETLLKRFAETYYDDLVRSRLIDYMKHEEWFKSQELEQGVLAQLTRKTEALTVEVKNLEEKLAEGVPTTKQKAALEGRLPKAREELAEAQKQTERLTAARRLQEVEKEIRSVGGGLDDTTRRQWTQDLAAAKRSVSDMRVRLKREGASTDLTRATKRAENRVKAIEKKFHEAENPTPMTPRRRAALEAEAEALRRRMAGREVTPGSKSGLRQEAIQIPELRGQIDRAESQLEGLRALAARPDLSARARFAAKRAVSRAEKHLDSLTRDLREAEAQARGVAALPGAAAQKAEPARRDIAREAVKPRLDEIEGLLKADEKVVNLDALKAEAEELKKTLAASKGKPTGTRAQAPTPEEITARTPGSAANPFYGPHPDELKSPRVEALQEGLRILEQMTEDQYLAAELLKAQQGIRTATGTAKAAYIDRINDIRKAQQVIKYANSGNKKKVLVKGVSRSEFARSTVELLGDRAKKVIASKIIAPFVHNAAGLEVEEARSLRVLLQNSQIADPNVMQSQVRKAGEVTPVYTAHNAAIEARFITPIHSDILTRRGFPPDLLSDLNAIELVTNLDEFKRALKDPRFNDFMLEFTKRMDEQIRDITQDPNYGLEAWLDDRLTVRADHFDYRRFEALEKEVSDAISAERYGFHRETRTDLIRPRGDGPKNVMAETIETDIRAVTAKAKVLSKHGVDPHAYNEARKVLRQSLIKKRTGQQIVAGAQAAAEKTMRAQKRWRSDPDWDELYRIEYEKEFDIRREALADTEAEKLLNQLAYEMHGATRVEVIAEFEKRYGMDFEIRENQEQMLTPFQHRTVQEAVKTLLDVKDLDDVAEMTVALQKHGQAPPFHSRDAMVKYLTKYGFWSRRTGDQIAASGSKSWDIRTESKYYADHWGSPPPWADAKLFERDGELHHLLHDEVERGSQWRAWGLFSRNMKARFETAEMGREERARFMVEGSEALGVKGKRDLAMERQYVIDRYGDIVTDDAGNLTAFPELMNRDEMRMYIVTRTRDELGVADGIFKTTEEAEVYYKILDAHVGRMADRMMAGQTVTFDDVYAMSAEIVHDMMLDPVWSRRGVDAVGDLIRAQATLRRSFVFTNPAFAGTNMVDSVIKAGWARFSVRSFHRGTRSEAALKYSQLTDWGFDPHGQLLRDVPVAARARIDAARARNQNLYYNFETGEIVEETVAQRAMSNGIQGLIAVTEFPASWASKSENFFKVRLAQGMYDEAYARALRDLGGDEGLADAAARAFIKDEVNRFWPTVGDGPIEQLFNQLFPFMSYQFKNRKLWLGELASHPYFYNYFNRIGDFIEAENRKRWKEEGTENQHTDVEARQIQLPWAPDFFLDIGAWTDAQAGLKPLYDFANGKATPASVTSQFVRLVSANEVNLFRGILNELDMGTRLVWVQGQDAGGYPNGVWTQVEVPWQTPWNNTPAEIQNSFWGVETLGYWSKLLDGRMDLKEATQAVYKTLFFGGLNENNPAMGLQDFYFTLRDVDPAKAKEWLLTPDGLKLKMYWTDKSEREMPRGFDWNPGAVNNILFPKAEDRSPWLHAQSKALQDKIKKGLDEKAFINRKYDNIMWELTPGTPEFAQAKKNRKMEIWAYYMSHPEMLDYEAGEMTPDKWARTLQEWDTDERTDEFFAIAIPQQKEGESAKKYQARLQAWRKQKTEFLKAFPTVAERLSHTRTSVEAVWKQTEEHWFEVLDRIGTRSIAIEASKNAKNYPLLDQLYLANELDFSQLNEDTAVNYFNPTTDFVPLGYGPDGKEKQGPRIMRGGFNGQSLLARTKVLPDFTSWRYQKADAAGKKKIENDFAYANSMKAVIDKAKKAKNFGASFVEQLKADPKLMREYFRRNPGKEESWATNDAYISLISRFGRLMKAGKFDEGHAYFDRLPDWVKDKYYNNNPEKRRQRQGSVENLQYLNYMKRWTAHYKKRDYEGGAAFFDSMPKWVKDRYYAKHPQGFGRGESGGFGSSPYSKAMGKWVKLLQDGHKDEAKAWFDSMPQAYRDKYYKGHPEAKLRDDIKRTGQLGEYFAANDPNRIQYLKDNPEFAKWLAKQGDSAQTRRMLITAAYRALPKGSDGAWMRRMYREKYPEIFSKEAVGEAALKKVYGDLVDNPELNPGFEKWLAAIWASYAENIKHAGAVPKPLEVIHPRQHGSDRATPHGGKSAAWVRLHSLS